ncbi:MAG: DUF4294 domain-containing protein [Bacteroidales bacterium]|jgi:hypothetical protein|nr:DUF4294 domain-containing protein [Bacteroidales bacterium]
MKKIVFLHKTNLRMRLLLLLISTVFFLPLFAQNTSEDKSFWVLATIIDGDTLPLVRMPNVYVFPPLQFKSERELANYRRLMRDVKKMYPYSQLAKATLIDIKVAMNTLPEGPQRSKYIKQKEDELVKTYSAELKACTIRQGQILLKLVDREINQTSYEIIKELRGSFSAFMWQGVARLFGETLKYEYDAGGEDAHIERIVCLIEMGMI